MPQFAFAENFLPQFAWLAVFFAILYFGIVRMTLPRVAGVMDAREGQVTGDIAAAEAAKAASDRAAAEHQSALDGAHASGRATVMAAQAQAAHRLAEVLAQSNAALAQKQAAADAALADARNRALSEIDGVAQDAAADIVERLTGKRPAVADLSKAAQAAAGA